MKIGILGGSFNPIHVGHLLLAEAVREKLKLDRIIFVPVNLPPHKGNRNLLSGKHRFQMIKLAIKGNSAFSVSDIEIKRKGKSYTIDTINEFKRMYIKDKLYFLTGSDLLKYLDGWKDLVKIIKMVNFVVASRPGYSLDKIPIYFNHGTKKGIFTVTIKAVDVSAFQIREAIRKNRTFRYLVPETVFDYIKRNGLYR